MTLHMPPRHRAVEQPPPARIDVRLRRALAVTLLAAVAVLVYGTVAAVQAAPPIPDRAVAPSGRVVYTHDDVVAGKQVFQRTGLMDFGTLYGNGAYFGPDWGTDYLHRQTQVLRDLAARQAGAPRYASLAPAARVRVDRTVTAQLRTNRYVDGVLSLTPGQVAAHQRLTAYYTRLFRDGDPALGLGRGLVTDQLQARRLTAFLAWTAWTSVAERPGHTYSYTNNWPHQPEVGNTATGSLWLWTWVSLAAVVVLIGVVFLVNRRIVASTGRVLAPPRVPSAAPLTPSQRATGKWFLLVPALLLAQGVVGSLLAHYFADRQSFFGLDISVLLPYQVLHAWHLQLAIAWVAAAWLGAGLFLGPLVGRREPRRQRLLANVLWAAVVAVVVGSLVGIYAGVRSSGEGSAWWWFGNQGLEYIQLGRALQIALFVGLVTWAVLVARAFWPRLRRDRRIGSLEGLLLASGAGIAVVYVFGMLPVAQPLESATMTDYWRWWVVHLWVEGMFEFFTVAVIGYAVTSIGLLPRRYVERILLLELILVFGSGVIGTGHHFYWVGDPAVWLSLGSLFGMLEVVPLVFMMGRAWREHRAVTAAGHAFPQRTAFRFFTAAAVWNLVGAGVLGGILNPPIVNYYEHGQFLTLAHGHAAMFGTFGLLAIGLMYFALRGIVSADWWSDRWAGRAFWLFNAAIVLWLTLNLLPVGVAQLVAGVQEGYWYSRSLAFYDSWTTFQWLRLVGDAAFLAGGGLLLLDVVHKLRHRRQATVPDGGDLPEDLTGDRPEPVGPGRAG